MIAEAPADILTALREQMEALEDGAKLPTVRELMRRFGVGQAIVQRAVQVLEADGLVRAEVGRGTFVIKQPSMMQDATSSMTPFATRATTPAARSVVILNHQNPGLRGEEIARSLQAQLLDQSHRAITVSYSDPAHAADLMQSMPLYDGIILRPSGAHVPVELLTTLKRRARAVVIEGTPLDGVDVDSVATDWCACVDLAIGRLLERGYQTLRLYLGQPHTMYARIAGQHVARLAAWRGLEVRVLETLDGLEGNEGVMVWSVANAAAAAARVSDRQVVVIDTIDLPVPESTRFANVGRRIDGIARDVIAALHRRWLEPQRPFIAELKSPEISPETGEARSGE